MKIYYDPTILNEDQIQQKIFSASKAPIRPITKNIKEVTVVTVLLENFFDTYDFSYLSILLKQNTEVVGLLSEYGCPVIVKIFFPGTTEINENPILFTFFVRPKFRTKEYLTKFWNKITEEFDGEFLAGIYNTNEPAKKFLRRNSKLEFEIENVKFFKF